MTAYVQKECTQATPVIEMSIKTSRDQTFCTVDPLLNIMRLTAVTSNRPSSQVLDMSGPRVMSTWSPRRYTVTVSPSADCAAMLRICCDLYLPKQHNQHKTLIQDKANFTLFLHWYEMIPVVVKCFTLTGIDFKKKTYQFAHINCS